MVVSVKSTRLLRAKVGQILEHGVMFLLRDLDNGFPQYLPPGINNDVNLTEVLQHGLEKAPDCSGCGQVTLGEGHLQVRAFGFNETSHCEALSLLLAEL
jgi:hypothetical protein